nr:zinc finger, CCHC-type [Tanacetum cinerariifolium]
MTQTSQQQPIVEPSPTPLTAQYQPMTQKLIILDPPQNTKSNPMSVHLMVTCFRVGSNRPTQCLNLHVSLVSPLPKSYRDAFNDLNWQNAMYGTLSRYKARLMANGSIKLEGVDADETCSLVVKTVTIWTVLSLAISRHWQIHQLDIKAFLKRSQVLTAPGVSMSTHLLDALMATNQTTNNNSIRSILDKEKLNGSKYLDWCHNQRVVLKIEQKLHHLEEALLEAPPATATATADVCNAYTRRDYDQFVQNYNMYGIGKTIPELHAMPKLAEMGIHKKTPSVLESAARILNMVPTKKVNKTPYEMWHGKVLNLSYLKVWGCEALVKRDTPNKVESRSIKCIFVGYPKKLMGYYFYYPLENKILFAQYDEFFKTNLIKQEASKSIVDFDEIQSEDAQPSEYTSLHQHEVEHDTVEPQTNVIHVCRSARIPQSHKRYGFYIADEEHELGDYGEPLNYRAALLDPESEKSKWLFKKKTDMDGNIHTYKAHLVAKGFTQTYKVDYEETYSHVAYIKAIRILIAILTYYDYEIWQMDVKTAFLNGRLNEDVYMVQPEGFVNPKHPRRIPTESMRKSLDYCKEHTKVYQKYQRYVSCLWGDSTTELGVTCYTDASWETDRDDLRSQTRFVFVINRGTVDWKSSKQSTTAMSSMEAEYIVAAEAAMEALWIHKFIFRLGVIPIIDKPMDMYYDNIGIFLSRHKYVVEILERAHMANCNPSPAPVDTKSKMGDDGYPVSDSTLYRSLASSLQYLTFTRPDIFYAVQQKEPLLNDRTSSKRQLALSRSSAKVEYRGVANVVAESCWLRNLLRELHTPLSFATLVYCDNASAVYLSCNPVQSQRTKHIEIDIHFVRDFVAAGQVLVVHVPSRYQYADIFTKGLPSVLFEEFRTSLSVWYPPAPTAGEC